MKKATLFLSAFFTLFIAFHSAAFESTAMVTLNHDVEYINTSESAFAAPESSRPRFGATPADSTQCVRNISLYAEPYNQGNMQMAYEFWREVFRICPQAQQNTFIRGAVIIRWKYGQETNPAKRDAWVDTLMMVYDQRIEHFGHMASHREGLVLGRKVVDLYQMRPNDILNIYEIARRSVQLEKNQSPADVLQIYMQATVRMSEAGLKPESEVLMVYDEVMNILEHHILNNPQDQLFQQARTNVDLLFEPFATCGNIISLFGPRFEKNSQDPELLEKITGMLNRAGCTDSKLFFSATQNLHRLKPTAQSAFLMGRMENTNENYREALRYFDQAIELYETDAERFTALLLAADINYRHLRQFPQARTYALRAAQADPKNGRPYLIIGEMYAASANQCGENELTRAVAYWAAVDKFIQARNVNNNDPVVQERATNMINTYRQYFPPMDIIFFHLLTPGESYRVDCWINETTTIRARN
jgi:tetratricopeptide (TPR) repeat protein